MTAMARNKPPPPDNPDARIAELMQAVRAVEEKLQLETRRLDESQALANIGSWETNLDTFEVTWTNETYRIFEVTPGEFQPTHERFLEVVHPDDRAKVDVAFVNSRDRSDAFAIEHRIRMPDGRIKVVAERWRTFYDETGKPSRAVGTCHDITARNVASEQLLETEDRHRDIVDAALDAIISIDHKGRIIEFNPSAEKVFGWTRDEVLHRELSELLIPERLRASHRRGLAAVVASESKQPITPRRSVLPALCADGSEILIELSMARLGHSIPPSFTAFIRDITERVQADAKLAESQQRYRDLVETSQDLIWAVDASGRISFMNGACREIYGREPEEMVGRMWLDFVPPEQHEKDLAVFIEAAKTGKDTLEYLSEVRRKDGSVVFLKANARILRDDSGRGFGSTGISRDMTESLRAEAALLSSEERLRTIVDNEPECVKTVSMDGRLLDMNPAGLRMIEADDAHTVVGQAIANLVHAEDRATFNGLHTRACHGQTGQAQFRIIGLKGTERWMESHATPLRATDGTVTSVLSVTRDVTQSKKAEEGLFNSEARFRALFDQAAVGMCLVSIEGTFLRTNRRFCEIVGYSAEALLGRSCIETTHPDDRAREAEITRRMRAGELQTSSWEKRYLHRDGRVIWCSLTLSLIPGQSGEPQQYVGVIEDITDRKAADLALVASNRALQVLSRCNEALIRSQTEADLLREICRIIVDVGGFAMAWVGYAQDNPGKTIEPQASAGVVDGYLADLRVSWSENDPTGGAPAGQVIRSGEPMIIPDLSREPGFAPWLAAAHAHGYAGVVVLPLKNLTRTFGVLVLYASEVRARQADELDLLRELADDLAFGIGHLRAEQGRLRMEAAVMKVAASVSVAGSEEFFVDLAVSVSEALDAQGAFVARLLPGEPGTARTVAAVVEGKVIENFEYDLRGTPCENLTDSSDCVVPANVAAHFSQSATLAQLGAQAYVGRRLVNAAGHMVGLIFVLFREPLTDSGFVVSTLQIFATRAAAEFDRLEADSRIREQAALLDKATDAIFVRDLEHRVMFWSLGAEKMYGWSAAEVLGRPTPEFLYPDPEAFLAAVGVLLEKGEWAGELPNKTKPGNVITLECRWTLVRNESGAPESVLCIETDITEKKKLEAQFLRAQRMESVGTLASGIAHDLNNILAPIMISVQILKEDAKDEDTLGMLNTLESCAQRGADLVRQVLSFARGLEGQQLAVDLAQLISEMQQVMREVFPKNVAFEVSTIPDLWPVTGDPTQLHQVFLNLCVNARDAMPHGGQLTIALENVVLDETYSAMNRECKAGAYVRVSVTDTGMGIPAAVLDKIFEPFFTTKELGKGTQRHRPWPGHRHWHREESWWLHQYVQRGGQRHQIQGVSPRPDIRSPGRKGFGGPDRHSSW